MTNVGIVGTGIYIPESFMTGKEISEKTMGVWSEEAVVDKLGIRKKPIPGAQYGTQEMGALAALDALKNTLILAVASSIIATVLGTLAALAISTMKKKWTKSVLMSVTNIPMMNPDIVTGVSLMLLFVFVGMFIHNSNVLGFPTLLIAHVTFNLPYVILSVLPKLYQTDKHLSEAAQDLGCTPAKAFMKVVLPSISSGIVTGMIMAFTLSLDDFIISYFVSGPSFQTLPIRIFSMTKKRVTPDMYALSTFIFVAILVLLVVMNVAQAKSDKKTKIQSKKIRINAVIVFIAFFLSIHKQTNSEVKKNTLQ